MKIKVISVLLALLILSGSAFVNVAAFFDTEGSGFEDSVNFLSALGIVNGKTELTFEPQKYLTRAEMSAIAIRLYNIEKVPSANEVIFSDVTAEHWAIDYISFANNLGIINGLGNGIFAPDEYITYPETIKILLSVLGFTVKAEAAGGYPVGYLSIAAQIGLLKNVAVGEGNITRGAMAQMTANAMDIPLFERTSYGTEKGSYTSSGTGTLLSEYYGITRYSGQVAATYYGKLSQDAPRLHKNEIYVDGKILRGDKLADNLLGTYIDVYAKNEDDTAVYMKEWKNSDTLTFQAGDISARTTKSVLYYEIGGNEYHKNISGAALAKNGQLKSAWEVSDIMPAEGSVTIISRDGLKYDTILVISYETKIVESAYAEGSMIYFKDNSTLTLDESDKIIAFSNYDGTKASITDCAEWDILSVASSEDGSFIDIKRSNRSVSGVINEIGDDHITVDKTEYEVLKTVNTEGLLNIECRFFINAAGKIAAVDIEEAAIRKYGYFIGVETTKDLEQAEQMQIFTAAGEMKMFKLADNLTYLNNDLSLNLNLPRKQFMNYWRLYSGTNTEQLIKYETNGRGKITLVETAMSTIHNSNNRTEVLSADKYIAENTQFIAGDMNMFECRYMVKEKCVIFAVPEKYTAETVGDYRVLKRSDLVHGENYAKFTLYDIDEENVIHAIVFPPKTGLIDHTSTEAIVLGVGKGINESGDPATVLTIFNHNGQKMDILVDNDFRVLFGENHTLTDVNSESQVEKGKLKSVVEPGVLQPGDIIRYELDSKGKVLALAVALRNKTPKVAEKSFITTNTQTLSQTWDQGNPTYCYGLVDTVLSYGIRLYISGFERIHVLKSGKVYVYDTSKQTIKSVHPSEIVAGDKVYVSRYASTERWLIAYR